MCPGNFFFFFSPVDLGVSAEAGHSDNSDRTTLRSPDPPAYRRLSNPPIQDKLGSADPLTDQIHSSRDDPRIHESLPTAKPATEEAKRRKKQ
jgi:hypothetical protein